MGFRARYFVAALIATSIFAAAIFWPRDPHGAVRVWERFGVEIVHRLDNDWSKVGPIGATITMEDPTGAETDAFIEVVEPEMARLPDGFFKKIKYRYIVLGKNLRTAEGKAWSFSAFNGAPVKGPSLYVYFDVQRTSDPRWLRFAFWHELFHFMDGELGTRSEDPEWAALNPRGFKYGSGKEEPKRPIKLIDPQGAFLTPYSIKTLEEDKADIFAALVLYPEEVKKASSQFPAIGKKAALMEKRLKAWGERIELPFWPLGERLPTNP